MFLVQHDQPQARQRREQRRPRAHDNVHFARSRLSPHVVPLAFGKLAVDHADAARKARGKAPDRLRRQADFGHEHDGLFALRKHRLDGVQVDFGLAAPRDTMQQVDRRTRSLRCLRSITRQAAELVGGERRRFRGHVIAVGQWVAQQFAFGQLDEAELFERFQVGQRATGFGIDPTDPHRLGLLAEIVKRGGAASGDGFLFAQRRRGRCGPCGRGADELDAAWSDAGWRQHLRCRDDAAPHE